MKIWRRVCIHCGYNFETISSNLFLQADGDNLYLCSRCNEKIRDEFFNQPDSSRFYLIASDKLPIEVRKETHVLIICIG